MGKIQLFHGTSQANAEKIIKEGFVTDQKHNWEIKSKKGFVYLSSAYAPFYCMNSCKDGKFALIKVEVDTKDLYPEDDFLMQGLGTPVYTQKELDKVNFKIYKSLWKESLRCMGNVAVKPNKIKIIGITNFDGKKLLYKCDPVIAPINFKFCGDYYKKLTEWIFEGKNVLDFPAMFEIN
jgi:hypothetical protein